jgi:hypothetical protein
MSDVNADTYLKAFVADVFENCKRLPAEYYFGTKVLINRVWAVAAPLTSLEDFKAKLLEANARRLLSLARADMPQLHDRQDINESEIRSYGATFHFLVMT